MCGTLEYVALCSESNFARHMEDALPSKQTNLLQMITFTLGRPHQRFYTLLAFHLTMTMRLGNPPSFLPQGFSHLGTKRPRRTRECNKFWFCQVQ